MRQCDWECSVKHKCCTQVEDYWSIPLIFIERLLHALHWEEPKMNAAAGTIKLSNCNPVLEWLMRWYDLTNSYRCITAKKWSALAWSGVSTCILGKRGTLGDLHNVEQGSQCWQLHRWMARELLNQHTHIMGAWIPNPEILIHLVWVGPWKTVFS